ncbi:MAG: ribosome silencing factor [Firmicutes bacterium]|jgi:ribosome-associated protein|nr:ribosome silencing factor [Bacillota bacterium]
MKEIKDVAIDIAGMIDEHSGLNVSVLDISKLSPMADYFVIATGKNNRHVNALAAHVEDEMGKYDFDIRHKEGHRQGKWILLDYSDIVIHIFTEEERYFYNLERIWADANKLDLHIDTF